MTIQPSLPKPGRMVQKCFVAAYGHLQCHLEVLPSEGQRRLTRVAVLVQEGAQLRPVLDETGQRAEFLSEHEGDALAAGLNFLERRFGPCTQPPIPCGLESAEARGVPLRWADDLSARRKVGGVSYEGQFFIVEVSNEWRETDPLPASSPEDQWFRNRMDFVAVLRAPWSRKPVDRRPWDASVVERPDKPSISKQPPKS
jgi:hypothetical protein